MPTSYTPNLGLALPVQGELAGVWGLTVNQEITGLLDNAVAGTTTLSSDADVTLTDTAGAANQSRQAILLWTANGTVTRTITAPARTKAYVVINATAGTQSIKLVGAGPTTGITIVAGEKCLAAWNGSDFVKVASTVVAASQITGTLGTANGGTGLTSFTANGVVYASSTSALTTGSALTFDGTNLGVGISSPTEKLTVVGNGKFIGSTSTTLAVGGGSSQSDLYIYGPSSGSTSLQLLTTAFGSYVSQSGGFLGLNFRNDSGDYTWALGAGNTEAMRLTSTGLGIGTSSPGVKLDVSYADSAFNAGIRVTNTANTSASQAKVYAVNNAGDYISLGRNSVALGGQSAIFSTGAYPLQFFTNSTLQATLDSSGNLGLGVTPSGWGVYEKALQFGVGGSVSASASVAYNVNISANRYVNSAGVDAYIATNPATMYRQWFGKHEWHTAPSGTAGNAITFTQAMTLTAAGNLGIGLTNPNVPLYVGGDGWFGFNGTYYLGNGPFKATVSTNGNEEPAFELLRSYSSATATVGAAKISVATTSGDLVFSNGTATLGGSNLIGARSYTERARIDASGNLGLGVTPSGWGFSGNLELGGTKNISFKEVYGNILSNAYYSLSQSRFNYTSNGFAAHYQIGANGQHRWFTAPSGTAGNAITFTQAMTLDANGNLLVGTTSGGDKLIVNGGIRTSGAVASNAIGGAFSYEGSGVTQIGAWGADNFTRGALKFYLATANGASGIEAARIDASGNLLVGTTSTVATAAANQVVFRTSTSTNGSGHLVMGNGSYNYLWIITSDNAGFNTSAATQWIGKIVSTGRSINAAGTVNASGADYAEYMTKAGDFTIAKGDVCGIDSNGLLTNVFTDAVSFVVKSTNPSYVGGDSWGAGFEEDKDGLEAARQQVDRIAFAGQVPVNVTGATPGQYIIPVNVNGAIKGQAVSNPTFEQYQSAVGKVIAIEADGRARIIVKVA